MSEKNPFFGATFAERKALRETPEDDTAASPTGKQVGTEAAENKAVKTSSTRKK